jgi:hypothetical protein
MPVDWMEFQCQANRVPVFRVRVGVEETINTDANNVVKPTDLASITLDHTAGRRSICVSSFRDNFVGNDALCPRFDQMSRCLKE